MTSVSSVFRYHITASGCDLARKLVQADAVVDDADCVIKPQHIKKDTKPTHHMQQHVSKLSDCQPPVAAVTAAAVAMDNIISDEDRDWQKEPGFVLSEHDHSHESR